MQNATITLTGSTFIYVQKWKSQEEIVHLGALPVLKMYNAFLITEKNEITIQIAVKDKI